MESNDRILEESRKYCDPYSILVIAGKKLVRVRYPFRVRVLVESAGWKVGDEKWVEKVMVTRNLQMVYLIGGNGYYFSVIKYCISYY